MTATRSRTRPRTAGLGPSTATSRPRGSSGRRVGDRRAHPAHAPGADHHRPREPRAAGRRAARPLHHQGHPHLRRTDELTVPLDDFSRSPGGQTITFPKRSFRTLEVRVDDTNRCPHRPVQERRRVRRDPAARRRPGAEDVRVDEVVRMPTDLVDAAGPKSRDNRLVYLMTRSRTRLVPPRYSEDELALVRKLEVPATREFSLRGTARISSAITDDDVDRLLGYPSAGEGGVTARSSQRLAGSLPSRASSAVDGDPATVWTSAFQDTSTKIGPEGSWVEVELPQPVTFDRLDLDLVADGRHSVPTRIRVEAGGEKRVVDVPAVTDRQDENAAVPAPVTFPALTGSTIRVTVEAIRPVETRSDLLEREGRDAGRDRRGGIPGVQRGDAPGGHADDVSRRRSDRRRSCGIRASSGGPGDGRGSRWRSISRPRDARGEVFTLDRGDDVVRSWPGKSTGVDVDQLVFGSDAGGRALDLGPGGDVPLAEQARAAPPEVAHRRERPDEAVAARRRRRRGTPAVLGRAR